MAFFEGDYENYYTQLSGSSNMSQDSSAISSKMSDVDTAISGVNETLSSPQWKEQGIDVLSQSVIPALATNVRTLMNNVSNCLIAAVSIVVDKLIPELENLKQESEKYEQCLSELNSLVVPPQYDKDGDETVSYREYVSRKNELEKELNEHKTNCETYQANINSMIESIKALDASVADFSASMSIPETNTTPGSSLLNIGEAIQSGKLLTATYGGKEFYIVNTKYPVVEYQKYLQKYGVYQNAGVLGDKCYFLAQYYAGDMLKGQSTNKDAVSHLKSQPGINNNVKSEDPEPVLEYIFNEIKQGRPTTLQVSQKNSNKGWRHVVTVVGVDSSVKSAADLTPDKILVLDCVDGKVQTLSERNRTLFNWNGVYQAWGANQAFIDKYVDTVNA